MEDVDASLRSSSEIDAEDVLATTNNLLRALGVSDRPFTSPGELADNGSSAIVALFERLFAMRLPDVIRRPSLPAHYTSNASSVIAHLRSILPARVSIPPGVSGDSVAGGDLTSIAYLVALMSDIHAAIGLEPHHAAAATTTTVATSLNASDSVSTSATGEESSSVATPTPRGELPIAPRPVATAVHVDNSVNVARIVTPVAAREGYGRPATAPHGQVESSAFARPATNSDRRRQNTAVGRVNVGGEDIYAPYATPQLVEEEAPQQRAHVDTQPTPASTLTSSVRPASAPVASSAVARHEALIAARLATSTADVIASLTTLTSAALRDRQSTLARLEASAVRSATRRARAAKRERNALVLRTQRLLQAASRHTLALRLSRSSSQAAACATLVKRATVAIRETAAARVAASVAEQEEALRATGAAVAHAGQVLTTLSETVREETALQVAQRAAAARSQREALRAVQRELALDEEDVLKSVMVAQRHAEEAFHARVVEPLGDATGDALQALDTAVRNEVDTDAPRVVSTQRLVGRRVAEGAARLQARVALAQRVMATGVKSAAADAALVDAWRSGDDPTASAGKKKIVKGAGTRTTRLRTQASSRG